MLIPTHTLFGIAALASGAAVLLMRKGTRRHRQVGWVYAAAMVLLCGGSFWIQDSTPFFRGFGGFHVAAVVSLVTLAGGIGMSLLRARIGPNWYEGHFQFMAWSYIGLVMATGSHFTPALGRALMAAGLPAGTAFPLTMALLWGGPPLVGALLLRRHAPRLRAQVEAELGASAAV